jgi:hypothetical protein
VDQLPPASAPPTPVLAALRLGLVGKSLAGVDSDDVQQGRHFFV